MPLQKVSLTVFEDFSKDEVVYTIRIPIIDLAVLNLAIEEHQKIKAASKKGKVSEAIDILKIIVEKLEERTGWIINNDQQPNTQ